MHSDTAPFYAGSTISDPRYFVGYREQLDTITVRAVSAQPTSINVVGEKRIGKSSLLYHFCQTYEQRIESRGKNPRNYLAIYLSLQQGNCQYKSGFYRVFAEELSKNIEPRRSLFGQSRELEELIQALNANNFDTESFYQACVRFRDLGILPIICLDKIESLFKHPDEFNDDFYDNLRSLMDCNALMLVIASEKNLQVYSRRKNVTSSFFNVGQIRILSGFTENEARSLVRLPENKIPNSQAVLNEKEQQISLEWGGNNPYLLQLAGLYIWEARECNKELSWARKRFNLQALGISTHHNILRHSLLFLKWLFWQLPTRLGKIGKFVGTNLGDIGDGIVGWSVIGIIIFVVFKKIPLENIIDAVKNVLGLGG